jgi:hypothetical protein
MTRDTFIFVLLLAVLIGLLVYYRRWEAKRLRLKSLDAMSPGLRQEIQEERESNLQKKTKFDEALQKANVVPRH